MSLRREAFTAPSSSSSRGLGATTRGGTHRANPVDRSLELAIQQFNRNPVDRLYESRRERMEWEKRSSVRRLEQDRFCRELQDKKNLENALRPSDRGYDRRPMTCQDKILVDFADAREWYNKYNPPRDDRVESKRSSIAAFGGVGREAAPWPALSVPERPAYLVDKQSEPDIMSSTSHRLKEIRQTNLSDRIRNSRVPLSAADATRPPWEKKTDLVDGFHNIDGRGVIGETINMQTRSSLRGAGCIMGD